MEDIAFIVVVLGMVGLGAFFLHNQHAEDMAYIQHGFCKQPTLGGHYQWIKCEATK